MHSIVKRGTVTCHRSRENNQIKTQSTLIWTKYTEWIISQIPNPAPIDPIFDPNDVYLPAVEIF